MRRHDSTPEKTHSIEVGIELPNTSRDVTAQQLLDFGHTTERENFPSLGALDRVVFHSYEPLMTFTTIAAVTKHIHLTTTILLTPLRNTTMLAKQTTAVHNISNSQLVLNINLGTRDDDYTTSDIKIEPKSKRFSHQLDELNRIQNDESRSHNDTIEPTPKNKRPSIIVNDKIKTSFKHATKYGDN